MRNCYMCLIWSCTLTWLRGLRCLDVCSHRVQMSWLSKNGKVHLAPIKPDPNTPLMCLHVNLNCYTLSEFSNVYLNEQLLPVCSEYQISNCHVSSVSRSVSFHLLKWVDMTLIRWVFSGHPRVHAVIVLAGHSPSFNFNWQQIMIEENKVSTFHHLLLHWKLCSLFILAVLYFSSPAHRPIWPKETGSDNDRSHQTSRSYKWEKSFSQLEDDK